MIPRHRAATGETVIVSFPFRVISSVYAAAGAHTAAEITHTEIGIGEVMYRAAVPTAKHTAVIAALPSQVLFGSARGRRTLCFPKRLPISAADISPKPHTNIAETAI